jgi:plastocyanin
MRVRLPALVAAVLIAAACGGGGDATSPTNGNPGGTTGGNPPPTPVPQNTVAVSDNQFTPANIQVAIGTTVTWTWASDARDHNVTFGDGTTSGNRSAGATYSKTFPTAGTFTYNCTLHGGMNGSVLVK